MSPKNFLTWSTLGSENVRAVKQEAGVVVRCSNQPRLRRVLLDVGVSHNSLLLCFTI